MMKSVRSLQSYFDVHLALRSESVKKSSKFALDKFSIFLKDFHQTSPDKIISDFADQQTALDLLQEFVNWYSQTKTQKGTKPNSKTVIQVFHNVKRYCFSKRYSYLKDTFHLAISSVDGKGYV